MNARADHYQAALERIAKRATGYQCWHVAEAAEALATAPGDATIATVLQVLRSDLEPRLKVDTLVIYLEALQAEVDA